jgi:hypothetical protein
MRPAELEEEGILENDGGGEFKYDIATYIVRTFVNAIMYPSIIFKKRKNIHQRKGET